MDKCLKYKTRRERDLDYDWRTKRMVDLSPRSELEKAIVDVHQDIEQYIKTNSKIAPEEALNLYLQARSLKHDVWVDFLKTNKAHKHYNFNDTSAKLFHETTYKDTIKADLPPHLSKLTPDILVRDPTTATLIIGDVTCTNYVRDASRRKHLKYEPLVDFYRSNGIRVKHIDFVIDNNLSNIPSQISELENVGLIRVERGTKDRTTHYFRIAMRDMENVKQYVSDRQTFERLLRAIDKNMETVEHVMTLPDDIIFEGLDHHTPEKTEHEIAMEIKNAAERLGENYFDSDITNVKKSLDKLRSQNKENEHCAPKSTLKAVFNTADIEEKTNYELISSYLFDLLTIGNDDVSDYIVSLLPKSRQLEKMSQLKRKDIKIDDVDTKSAGVYGPNQYRIDRSSGDNMIASRTFEKLLKGKRIKNIKQSPKVIDPDRYNECYNNMNEIMKILGKRSDKPPVMNDDWDVSTNMEAENTKVMFKHFSDAKSSNGAQLCQAMSMLYQRLCHLKTSLSVRDNVFVPQNSSFICIIPKDHAPVTSSKCDVPLIFIARCRKDSPNLKDFLSVNEYEYRTESDEYIYLVSKLCRLSIDKMANWDQSAYNIVATSSYIASQNHNLDVKRVVGVLTVMRLDLHQKTSELLDLLKYVGFMPFADLTRLSALIEDKFNILIKTQLDVWTLKYIEDLMNELSKKEMLNAHKPKLHIHNGIALHDSFGIHLELPSVFNIKLRHNDPAAYIEEVSMIYIVRGKQLYGSQFLDKSTTMTAKWEMEFREEQKKFGDWVETGNGNGEFPFESKFAFSKDAIVHAYNHFMRINAINSVKVMNSLQHLGYNEFMHYNCSLRGCVKEQEDRKTPADIHTTSMEACLVHYKRKDYDQEQCTNVAMAYEFLRSGKQMEFSMSEKEQRGGGRPIATPTILTKAALTTVEKPEASIGKQCANNIIVPGKNKMKEICDTYKNFITNASIEGYKHVYQITEDQTKFSEMDNPRKFAIYADINEVLDPNVRRLQKTVIKKLQNRVHLVKRMPKEISETELAQTLNEQGNGVTTQIGWPQGMCNFMSTSIHMIADEWITHLYNIAYPNNQVSTRGLVHSDDSWVVIACNDPKDFEMFLKFRIMAKRCFCLKMNEKKLWASKYLGELVSNYNLNGNVHMSIAKIISNCFNNLNYINWVLDVHSQISTLQQVYRNGCNLPTLILLSTILRHQIMAAYNINGKQKQLLHLLPIEIGGYPSSSAFEMATTGAVCHYQDLITYIKKNPTDEASLITLKCLSLSIAKLKNLSDDDMIKKIKSCRIKGSLFEKEDDDFPDDDYTEIKLPYRGDVFVCIKHLQPQSVKIKKTIAELKSLPFSGDQMELIVTRPKKLSTALGNLKDQTSTMTYQLASERYTQSSRRLAISQSMQATGKVIKLGNLKPMTINELLTTMININVLPATIEQLQIAFTDSNPVPAIAHSVVFNSECDIGTKDKRKIINRLPDVDDNFKTLVKMRDVLLYIIDSELKTNYYEQYKSSVVPLQLIERESNIIKGRFSQYFHCYNVKTACSLIIKLDMEATKTRLWMQPYLNQESLTSFLEDLYGKTLSPDINYTVKSITQQSSIKDYNSDVVNTIYSIMVLDTLYEGKFRLMEVDGKDLLETLKELDYSMLSQDDLLKAGIMNYLADGDQEILKYYNKNKVFSKKYLKAQTYVNGAYTGSFKILVKFGSAVMTVSGVVGNVSIEVNGCSHINDILMAMMLLVNDSFPNDRYNNPSMWYQSQFWRNKYKIGNMFMTSYTMSLSLITQTSNQTSIPMKRNDRLRFDESEATIDDTKFYIDKNLRQVFKEDYQGKRVKIGNVKQSLYCPMAKKAECYPEFLEGFDNNELLHTKAIFNITLRKPYATSKNVIKNLIKNNLQTDDSLIVNMYKNLLHCFTNNIKPSEATMTAQDIEIIEYELQGSSVAAIIEASERTSPDDLESVQTMFVEGDDTERSGALIKYSNILRYFSRALHPTDSKEDIDGLLTEIFKDRFTLGKIKEDAMDETTNELLEELLETTSKTASVNTLSYILAFELDLAETWENLNIKEYIVKSGDKKGTSKKIHKVILKDMVEVLYDREVDDDKNCLLEMLETNKSG